MQAITSTEGRRRKLREAPSRSRRCSITMQPTDGLDVGAERGAPVGPYAAGNVFAGVIEGVTICIVR